MSNLQAKYRIAFTLDELKTVLSCMEQVKDDSAQNQQLCLRIAMTIVKADNGYAVSSYTIQGNKSQDSLSSTTGTVRKADVEIPPELRSKFHKLWVKYKTLGPESLTWMEYWELSTDYTIFVDKGNPKEFRHSDEFEALMVDIVFIQKREKDMYSTLIRSMLPTETYSREAMTEEERQKDREHMAQVAKEVDAEIKEKKRLDEDTGDQDAIGDRYKI